MWCFQVVMVYDTVHIEREIAKRSGAEDMPDAAYKVKIIKVKVKEFRMIKVDVTVIVCRARSRSIPSLKLASRIIDRNLVKNRFNVKQ